MPVRVGKPDAWQTIQPTTEWKTMSTPLKQGRVRGRDRSVLRQRLSLVVSAFRRTCRLVATSGESSDHTRHLDDERRGDVVGSALRLPKGTCRQGAHRS